MLIYLFLTFFQIGLFSIGGGYAIIPLIQEQVVQIHGWITQKTFADIITISQMTPGPLAVNTSTFVGLQVAGIWGAVLATIGCILAGVVISIVLCWFFSESSEVRVFVWTAERIEGGICRFDYFGSGYHYLINFYGKLAANAASTF